WVDGNWRYSASTLGAPRERDRIPVGVVDQDRPRELPGPLNGNPVMSDGNALFSTAHRNLASPAGIDLASMTATRKLMAARQPFDGRSRAIPRISLVGGPLWETPALHFTTSTVFPTRPGAVTPPYFKTLTVVVDPRIKDAS